MGDGVETRELADEVGTLLREQVAAVRRRGSDWQMSASTAEAIERLARAYVTLRPHPSSFHHWLPVDG